MQPYELPVPDMYETDMGNGESHIKFPVALEKALDLKSERVRQIGSEEEQILGNFRTRFSIVLRFRIFS